jgi:Kef-type K+ transport system membrane component KefB/nucleotide-binding universal stress UspA family protein
VRRARGTAIAVSLTGIAIPFACGFALGQVLPDSLLPPAHRLVSSLFLGTALSISSVKIVASVVREMNFMRRNLGQVIVASAIIEDSVGWVIIAITFGIAQTGRIEFWSLLKTVGGVGLFLLFSFTLGQYVVFRVIRWVNDNFRSEFAVVSAILVIMGLMALVTYALGVQTVLGAFVAGILVGESPILTEHIQNQLRGLVAALFMPVFFGQAGIAADLSILGQPQLLGLTAVIIAIASLGKFGGAFAGGRFSGMSLRESLALGCGMNARGSTEVIVATIGLSMTMLTQNLFTMIVTMAVVTTMAMPPMLRMALSRLPIRKEEKERLEREELDARGFFAKIERMLLLVDDTANGRLAARLAGYLAGVRGMPLTVMRITPPKAAAGMSRTEQPPHEEEVKQSATAAAAAVEQVEEEAPRPVDVTVQPPPPPQQATIPEAVADLTRKGFGLLFVGIDATRTPDGSFTKKVTDLVAGFENPFAVLVPPESGEPNFTEILVPVSGTDVSRRGAEVAFVLAHAAQLRVSAVYAAPGGASPGARTRRSQEAVLSDIAQLGRRYEIEVTTQIARRELTETRTLQQAARRQALIVMGVNRRPGDVLFFGNTAAALLKDWKGPILFIAS